MEQRCLLATRHSFQYFPHSPLPSAPLHCLHVMHLLLNLSKIRMRFKGWIRALNITLNCNASLPLGSQACLTIA